MYTYHCLKCSREISLPLAMANGICPGCGAQVMAWEVREEEYIYERVMLDLMRALEEPKVR